MAFAVKPDERYGDGLARLARKRLRAGIVELEGKAAVGEAIHAARKSVKKVRAIIALVASDDDRQLRAAEKRLRRVGHRLSALRDAQAIADTFQTIAGRVPRAASEARRIARRLTERVRECEKAVAAADLRAKLARALRQAEHRIRQSALSDVHASAIADGLKRSYRDGRRALKKAKAKGRVTDFHRWRRRVKTFWYQLRLQDARWPARRLVAALEQLEEALGEDHNVAVLRANLARDKTPRDVAAMALLDRACDQYQRTLRRKALALGTRIYRRAPKAVVKQLRRGKRMPPAGRKAA